MNHNHYLGWIEEYGLDYKPEGKKQTKKNVNVCPRRYTIFVILPEDFRLKSMWATEMERAIQRMLKTPDYLEGTQRGVQIGTFEHSKYPKERVMVVDIHNVSTRSVRVNLCTLFKWKIHEKPVAMIMKSYQKNKVIEETFKLNSWEHLNEIWSESKKERDMREMSRASLFDDAQTKYGLCVLTVFADTEESKKRKADSEADQRPLKRGIYNITNRWYPTEQEEDIALAQFMDENNL